MKLYKNQSGFSPIETIIVIVMIGLTGAVGWLVYDRQKQSEQSAQTPATINSFEECVAAGNPVMESYPEQCSANGKSFTKKSDTFVKTSEYEGKRYVSSKNGFSMMVLNGWKIKSDTTYDYLFHYGIDGLVYSGDASPSVENIDGSGVGGWVSGMMVSINQYEEDITTGSKFMLNDGTTGYCNDRTYNEQEIEESQTGPEENLGKFIQKQCSFSKNGNRVNARYGYFEKMPLDVKAIEWAFKTIEVK